MAIIDCLIAPFPKGHSVIGYAVTKRVRRGKRAASAPKFSGKLEGKGALSASAAGAQGSAAGSVRGPGPGAHARVRYHTDQETLRGPRQREGAPGVQGMENQIPPKAEVAEVAELELEAAIGFNGEASNVSGRGVASSGDE